MSGPEVKGDAEWPVHRRRLARPIDRDRADYSLHVVRPGYGGTDFGLVTFGGPYFYSRTISEEERVALIRALLRKGERFEQ